MHFFFSFFKKKDDILYVVCKLSPKMQMLALVFHSSKAVTNPKYRPLNQEGVSALPTCAGLALSQPATPDTSQLLVQTLHIQLAGLGKDCLKDFKLNDSRI